MGSGARLAPLGLLGAATLPLLFLLAMTPAAHATVQCAAANGNKPHCDRMFWKGCYWHAATTNCLQLPSCEEQHDFLDGIGVTNTTQKKAACENRPNCSLYPRNLTHTTELEPCVSRIQGPYPDTDTCAYFNDFDMSWDTRFRLCTSVRGCEWAQKGDQCVQHRNVLAQHAVDQQQCEQDNIARWDNATSKCHAYSRDVSPNNVCSSTVPMTCNTVRGCKWSSLLNRCMADPQIFSGYGSISSFCSSSTEFNKRRTDQYFDGPQPSGVMTAGTCAEHGDLCVWTNRTVPSRAETCTPNGHLVCHITTLPQCGLTENCQVSGDGTACIVRAGTPLIDYDTGPATGDDDDDGDDHTSSPDFNVKIHTRNWKYDSNNQRLVGTVDVPLHWYPGDPFSYYFAIGDWREHSSTGSDTFCRSYEGDMTFPTTLPVNNTFLEKLQETLMFHHDFVDLYEQDAFAPVHTLGIVNSVDFIPSSKYSDGRARLSYGFFIDVQKILYYCNHLGAKAETLGTVEEMYTIPINFYAVNKHGDTTEIPFQVNLSPFMSNDAVTLSLNPTAYQFSARVAAVLPADDIDGPPCPPGENALDIIYRLAYQITPRTSDTTAVGPVSPSDIIMDSPSAGCINAYPVETGLTDGSSHVECVDNYCSTYIILRTACYNTAGDPDFFARCPVGSPSEVPRYGFRVNARVCKSTGEGGGDDCSSIIGTDYILSTVRYRLGGDQGNFTSDTRMIVGLLKTPQSPLSEMTPLVATDGVVGNTPTVAFVGDHLPVVMTLDSAPRRRLFYLLIDPGRTFITAYDKDGGLIEECWRKNLTTFVKDGQGVVSHLPWLLDDGSTQLPRMPITTGEDIGVDGFAIHVKTLQAACPGVYSISLTLRGASFRHDNGRDAGLPPLVLWEGMNADAGAPAVSLLSTTEETGKQKDDTGDNNSRPFAAQLLAQPIIKPEDDSPPTAHDSVQSLSTVTGFSHVEYSSSSVVIVLPVRYHYEDEISTVARIIVWLAIGGAVVLAIAYVLLKHAEQRKKQTKTVNN